VSRGPVVAVAIVVAAVPAAVAQTATVSGMVRIPGTSPARTVVYLAPHTAAVRAPSPDSVLIDQYELRFVPSIVVVQPGATVLFRNSDPVMHNVFSPRGAGPGFNLGTYPQGEARSHVFAEPGGHIVLCHVHPEMAVFVVVVETSYHTTVDDTGRFTIADVPAGHYTLRTWHWRRPGAEVAIELRPGERRTLEIHVDSRARGDRP